MPTFFYLRLLPDFKKVGIGWMNHGHFAKIVLKHTKQCFYSNVWITIEGNIQLSQSKWIKIIDILTVFRLQTNML